MASRHALNQLQIQNQDQNPDLLPPLEQDPEQISELTEEILERSEFQPPEPNIFERILNWIGERFGDRAPDVVDPGQAGSLSPVVTWVIVAIAVAVVAFAGWRIYKSWTGLPKKIKSDDDRTTADEVGTRRRPKDWIDEAEEHEAAGRWAEAVRCWYRVAVARLADRNLVRDTPGRTSGEYRVEVQTNAPDVAPTFDQASDVFDNVWYGGSEAGPNDTERLRELSASVGSGRAPK